MFFIIDIKTDNRRSLYDLGNLKVNIVTLYEKFENVDEDVHCAFAEALAYYRRLIGSF